MGIYDREYYRGERPSPGWFSGPAPWCKTLILINVVVFLVQRFLDVDDDFVNQWLAASPQGIFHQGKVWELLTATFLHDQRTLWHILGNMVFLWFVGREMESLYGSRDFLAFYLAAAVVSTFCWAAVQSFSPGPQRYMIGASGAVMAVMTLFTLFYPRREIIFLIVPMPMWLLLTIYLVWPLFGDGRGGPIAYESHLAGAAFAYIFKQFDLRWSRLVDARIGRPRLKVVSPPRYEATRPRTPVPSRGGGEAVGAVASSVSVLPEEQLDARLDEVLAKIAREGGDGLTEEERRVLDEASRRARDRRSDRR